MMLYHIAPYQMSALTLTRAAAKTELDNITLYEPIDVAALDKLIESDVLLNTINNPLATHYHANERELLKAYREKVIESKGVAKVTYHLANKMSYGRVHPRGALGLFSIRRQIRHTISRDTLVDIDVVNCHPVILQQVCKKNDIGCANLSDYVHDRDEHLDTVMDTYGVSREIAKDLYIRLMFGGKFTAWREDIAIYRFMDQNDCDKETARARFDRSTVITKPATEFIAAFEDEMGKINKRIAAANPELAEQIKKHKDDLPDCEMARSVVSYFLQDIERSILETVYKYADQKGLLGNGDEKFCVLAADGIMIPKTAYYEELPAEFSKEVKQKLGIAVSFVEKKQDQGYDLALVNKAGPSTIIKGLGEYYDYATFDPKADFSVKTLTDLFFKDVATVGDSFRTRFHMTNSFRYFNAYHAHFYVTNTIYKLYNNSVTAYADFKSTFDHLFYQEGKTRTKFTQLYLESRHKRCYSTFHFKPNNKEPSDACNLFTGFRYDTSDNKTYNLEVIRPFIEHIEFVCGEEGQTDKPVSNYLLNWFAHIFQRPERKTKTAIVIYSLTEGIGKNLISDLIAKLLEGYAAKFRDTSALTDRFNVDMMAKLFVVGDEINARASEVANELKDIITRQVEVIEPKGKDKMFVDDFKNYFFTTNNEQVFKVSNSDRRFMFIEAPLNKKSHAYYSHLFEMMEDHTVMKHIHNYFASRDITEFEPATIIKTDYKRRLQLAQLPAYIRYVKDNWTKLTTPSFSGAPKEHRTTDLYHDTIEFAKANRLQSTFTEHTHNIMFARVFGQFKKLNKERKTVYVFREEDAEVVDELINKFIDQ